MTLRIAPGIDVPDCLSEQSPCSKQEYDGEHEQAWHEQKFSANQVIYDVNNLNEGDQYHEPSQHPPRPHYQEQQQHHCQRKISCKHIVCIDPYCICHWTSVRQEGRIYLTNHRTS